MKGITQFRIQYIYTWKCHNETPYIVILNKQKCLFSKMKEGKINRSCLGVGTSGRGNYIKKG
jgi:hypothetical protein